jgi:hypothetical protein
MQEPLDALEARIAELRRAVREALAARESTRVSELRAELRRAERAWDALVTPDGAVAEEPPDAGSLLPAREQVHQALTLLGVPSAPRLIAAVHAAFFTGQLAPSRLTSLRRDEERSYRSAPNARPYYLCPALTAELLSPARALLCISTWPMEQRIVGPLSPRVDFLTAAIRVAETAGGLAGAGRPGSRSGAKQLLRRFAMNIPGALDGPRGKDATPGDVAAAAKAELDIHAGPDTDTRAQAARRARQQLDGAGQLFGARLAAVPRSGTA